MAISSLASRLLGLARDGLFAGTFGTSDQAGIYFAAFKIPDFLFNFLIAGGLSVVFLPVFAEYMRKSEKEGWEMANSILNGFLALVSVFAVICFIFTPQLLRIFLPGFSSQQIATAVPLTRLLLLSPIFLGLSSLLSSILMHFNNFINFSLAPAIYNLCIIFGIIFLAPAYGVFGVGIGVALGAFLHMAVQIPPALKAGLKFKFENGFKHSATKQVFISAIPRTIAAASQQLDDLLTTGIVSAVVSVSGISVLAYAYNIQFIPVGLFAIPFAVAIFPILSKQWAAGDKQNFLESFSNMVRQIIFFITPMAVLLFILRAQAVRLILGTLGKTGVFDIASTKITAACLGIYAMAIIATGIVPIFIRGFFAAKDTKTPTIISVSCIAVDIAFSWIFPVALKKYAVFSGLMARLLDLEGFKDLAVIGVPMAWLLAATLQALFLGWFFYKKIGDFGFEKLFRSFFKIAASSVMAGIVCYFGLMIFGNAIALLPYVKDHLALSLFMQSALAGIIAVGAYIALCKLFKVEELEMAKRAILGNGNSAPAGQ